MENKLSTYFLVEDTGFDGLLDCMNLQKDDTILYLGGRIDDDNLYPANYRKYLNFKIKELNPKKIICHSHWYAWKYYDSGILDKSTKIDMVLCNYFHLLRKTLEPINKEHYRSDHYCYIERLVKKNLNIFFAAYRNPIEYSCWPPGHSLRESNEMGGSPAPESTKCYTKWFSGCDKNYNLNNIKYFTFQRGYSPTGLTSEDLGHGKGGRNSTDGFGIIIELLKLGLKNLNIAGFSGFGSDEDQSYFSNYISELNSTHNKNYFQIETSEDQKAEADILKYWAENKKIYNLENYSKLISCLKIEGYNE